MSYKLKLLQGSASNLTRVGVSTLAAILLPPIFVHHMPPAEYGAWILILQCSAYVSFLDLSLQTSIGKFIAEYDALNDRVSSSRVLSSAFAILCASALAGAIAISLISRNAPSLFHQMPPELVGRMQRGILLVGLSAVVALPFNAFLAVFVGLQRYGYPTILASASKVLSTAALILTLFAHGGLLDLAWVMAGFNVATALAQLLGWQQLTSSHAHLSFSLINRRSLATLTKYSSMLSVWQIAMLLISGLDLFIIGHYDYRNTAYYGVATAATNFMVLLAGSIFGPLIPAVSALQTTSSPSHIGQLVIRLTRYAVLFICAVALPLLAGAHPILTLWVGHEYASRSTLFLQILVAGNAVRLLCLPYSLVIIATGTQHLATISALLEASVNFALSIFLVQKIGAEGVAIGTMVGAILGVTMHIVVSMRLTRTIITLSPRHFITHGVARSLPAAIPSLFAFLYFRTPRPPGASLAVAAAWCLLTAFLAWTLTLTAAERSGVKSIIRRFSRQETA